MFYEIYEDKAGEFRWRMKAKNGKVIADSGEGYKRRVSAEKAAHRCWSLNQSYFYDIRVEGTKLRKFAKDSVPTLEPSRGRSHG